MGVPVLGEASALLVSGLLVLVVLGPVSVLVLVSVVSVPWVPAFVDALVGELAWGAVPFGVLALFGVLVGVVLVLVGVVLVLVGVGLVLVGFPALAGLLEDPDGAAWPRLCSITSA